MKTCFITLALLAISSLSFGQYQLDEKKMQLNLGAGLSSWGFPVYFGLDYGLMKNISVGGEVSFRGYNEKIGKTVYRSSIIGISVNGNYHFNHIWHIPEPWDVYAGPNIGFYHWNYASNYPGVSTSPLGLGAQIGARCYLTNRFALNLEVGTGNAFSNGKFGMTFLLK